MTGRFFRAGSYRMPLGQKTYVLGILNVTPDSFSDGGSFLDTQAAIRQAERLIGEGADILDIGGESTRPGSRQVPAAEQISRILPVISAIVRQHAIPISVDTASAEVASAALAAGATIVNDISGLLQDEKMADVIARAGAGAILMHNATLYRQDHPAAAVFVHVTALAGEQAGTWRSLDLLPAVRAYLRQGCEIALAHGLAAEQLILDPGLGFGLTTAESLQLIDELAQIQCLPGYQLPVLIGSSRKRFIGEILNRPVDDRLWGTAATVAASVLRGADFVRVHDVGPIRQVVQMCDAICRRTALPAAIP